MSIPELLIKNSFFLAVRLIRYFANTKHADDKSRQFGDMSNGSLGKAIADCLRDNNLQLVPYYESHDLKHVLLGYQMTPLDEIRMQAFMLGNGNWTIPSIAIFLYGALLLPNKWKQFVKDYHAGRQAVPIGSWTIESFAHKQISELRGHVLYSKAIKPDGMKYPTVRGISFATIIAGVFGMLFCLPYLWSSNMADLIGAGLPFIAGAILVAGGLMSIALLGRDRSGEVAHYA